MKAWLFFALFITCEYVYAQNVGIGTNAPHAKLDIKGSFKVGGGSQFLSYDSLSGKFNWNNSYLFVSAAQYIMQHSASAEGLYYSTPQLEYRHSDGTPRFFTNWSTGAGYFYGNLGISTTAPGARLHVRHGSSGYSGEYFFGAIVEGEHNTYVNLLTPSYRESGVLFGSDTSVANGGIVYNNADNPNGIQFRTNGNSTKMVLTNGGNVGVGTSYPYARLHVADSSVVFSSDSAAIVNPGPPPISGPGSRMMWYADKAAFRAGYVDDAQWDKDSIGIYSFASGYLTRALAFGAVALGNKSVASGENSVALGADNLAFGVQSTAMGNFTRAMGDYSFATGYLTTATGHYSSVFGSGSQANGEFGFATGYGTEATGSNSSAFGWVSKAIGEASFATGYFTEATGSNSSAFGWSSMAIGVVSFATGHNTQAIGDFSSVFGQNSIATGKTAFAAGRSTSARGDYSTCLGIWTEAKAYGATSIGLFNDITDTPDPDSPAVSDRIFQIGNGSSTVRSTAITVLRNGKVGIHLNNPLRPLSFDESLGDKISLWGNGAINYGFGIQNGLFQIHTAFATDTIAFGYGSSEAFTERMRIQGNGNVGIGTTTPAYLLDVNGRIRVRSEGGLNTSGIWFNNNDNTTTTAFVGMLNDGPADTYIGLWGNVIGWGLRMNVNNGYVSIGGLEPVEKLTVLGNAHVIGNICATGSIGACSDIRYKKDFSSVSGALRSISQLHALYYYWNADAYPEKHFNADRQLGFSAQEVEQLFPEIVQTGSDGYKSVDYGRLTPVLVEAIKEQQDMIEQCFNQNLEQQRIIDELNVKIELLMNAHTAHITSQDK